VDSFRNGNQARIEKAANLELLFGEACFAGPRLVEVRMNDGSLRVLSAKNIFINAGTRAARPKLDGLNSVPFLDNASIMKLEAIPEHLLILGDGYISLEFGQLFRHFGNRVSIIQSAGQLLTREDPDIAKKIAKILRKDDVDVVLKAKATDVSWLDEKIHIKVQQDGKSMTLVESHLLIATGRTPN